MSSTYSKGTRGVQSTRTVVSPKRTFLNVEVPSLKEVTEKALARQLRLRDGGTLILRPSRHTSDLWISKVRIQQSGQRFEKQTKGPEASFTSQIDFFTFGPNCPAIFGPLPAPRQFSEEVPPRESKERSERRQCIDEQAHRQVVPESTVESPSVKVAFFEFDPPCLPYLFDDPNYFHNKEE